MSDIPPSDGDQASLIFGNFEPIEIQEEMERSFLDYSMSVITSRALPDVKDGLKPVQRRILWGMYDIGARPDRSHMKCARVTGDVMGKYHPHGDGAIYDALVRLAQDFTLRHPLVDGHGNFGSPDFGPAASRYTECRLSTLAMRMIDGIDENTVDFEPNYSGEFTQPSVLPSRFPNLLVNGNQGIAVGMATSIPPHNLGEVIDATNHLIDNPDATVQDLMQFVKGPDFPTGAQIMGRQGIIDAFTTGRGSIKLRAVAEIEEGARNAHIVVTEMPYQTSISTTAAKIKELVETRQIEGIADVNDESGVRRREAALRQDHRHVRCRRRRQPHPHVAAHVLLPEHEVPSRSRAHLHRAATAVLDRGRQGEDLPEGRRRQGAIPRRQPRPQEGLPAAEGPR